MQTDIRTLENLITSVFYAGESSDESFPKICALHATMQSPQGTNHTCIACNFADIIYALKDVAKSMPNYANSTVAKMTYLLWLYLLAERMQEIFKLISLPEEIKETQFLAFTRTKRWGNFLKHPKAFFLTHHPKMHETPGASDVRIDDAFIQKYYSGDKHNAELYRTISNSQSVVVQFPDLNELTCELAADLDALQKIIHDNPIYQTVLRSKTVLENYYSSESATS